MKLQKIYLQSLSIIAFLFSTACTSSYQSAQLPPMVNPPTLKYKEAESVSEATGQRYQNSASRKVISSAAITLAIEEPDSANKQIVVLTQSFQGYVSYQSTEYSTIRVPSNQLEPMLNALSQLGKVQSQSLSGHDVTDQYTDYQIRLENALKSRERYLELLSKAEDVKTAVQVERELERLNETIDQLKGKISQIDHLSDFATINIFVQERKKPGLLGYVGLGLYHSVKWLFVRN
jgi:hypothetical protein